MALDPNQKFTEDLTAKKQKSNKLGLSDIHKDLTDIKDRLGNDDSLGSDTARGPLASLIDEPDSGSSFWDDVKQSAIKGIYDALGIEGKEDAATDSKEPELSNQRIYEEFMAQVKRQQDLLLDATKEQTVIFKQLEDTIKQLKIANKEDSSKLRKSIDKLVLQLKGTPETEAKRRIERMAPVRKPKEPAAKTEGKTKAPAPAPRTSAVPAMALAAVPTTKTMNLFEDADTLSSESEGDQVQTGEREADMATILGFLGSMFGGGNNNIVPIGNPLGRSRGGPVAAPGGSKSKVTPGKNTNPVIERTRKDGTKYYTQKGTKGFVKPPQPASKVVKPDLLSKAKSVAGRGFNVAKSFLSPVGLGITAMLYSGEAGAGSDQVPRTTEELQQIEDFRKKQAAEIAAKTKAPAPVAAKPDSQVLQQSLENKDLAAKAQQPAAPVVINTNNQTNAGGKPPAYIAPTLEIRPKESALNRYIMRESFY